jgi:hypothetical protein
VAARGRRRYAILGGSFAVVAGAVAAAVVLAFGGSSSSAAPTKTQYFARVAAICRVYGPKLDRIPPPSDLGIPSELSAAARKALPVLRAEADAVRRLESPWELRSKLVQWTRLNDRSITDLAEALRQDRQKNLRGIQIAYVGFLVTGAKAQRVGRSIGFPSPPC